MRFDGFRRNPLHKTYLMIHDKCCPTAESTNGSQWILHRYRYQIHFLDLIKSERQDHSKHPSRVVNKSQKPDSLFQALSWSWPAKLWWAQEKVMQRLGSPLILFLYGFFHSRVPSSPPDQLRTLLATPESIYLHRRQSCPAQITSKYIFWHFDFYIIFFCRSLLAPNPPTE